MTKGELREKLAAIEHERWADWQKWVHSKMFTISGSKDSEDVKAIPYDLYIHWENQIATPYDALPEHSKQSDREQVDRYWPLIEEYLEDKEMYYDRICTFCGKEWQSLHSKDDGYQNPCPICGKKSYPEWKRENQ